MRSRLGSLASVVVVTLALGAPACGGKKVDEGGATVPRASTTTGAPTTTSPEDAFAIPETIDAAYVNRVMAALNKVYGDVVRKKIETRQFEEADLVAIRAIYSEDETAQVGRALAESPVGAAEDYPDPIGDRRVVVEQLVSTSAACIAFRATFDSAPVTRNAAPPKPGWVTLRRKDPAADPTGLNPTPWIIAVEEFHEVSSPCAG